MEWWAKVIVQNGGKAQVEPKNHPGRVMPTDLSHHHEFCYNQPPVGRRWKLIVQWFGYMLFVLVWFCLMHDLEWFPKIRSHIITT